MADTLVYRIVDEYVRLAKTDLTVSTTTLHPYRSTRGHKHDKQDELYIFCQCDASTMEVDDERIEVQPGMYIYVQKGAFHRVVNNAGSPCIFVTLFGGNAARPSF